LTSLSNVSRIGVVGGGPGGAFAARLLKLAQPRAEVTLYDALPAEDTFGFGVGLSVSTQQNLGRSDPETFARIARASHSGHGLQMYSNHGCERIAGNGQMAIARSQLLKILYDQAADADVRLEIGARVDAFALDADMVVAADGGGSATRSAAAEAFGVRETVGRQKYIWCGADQALPDALFAPVMSESGVLTTHAYPYSADRSTFLVETDQEVWRAAGFDRDMSHLEPGESDEEARALLESVFKEHLGGASLLGNNSRWTQFRTIHCDRWYHKNVVLLGDAAHTAHYSVGSGTKLAMEDAIALTAALASDGDDLERAFEVYRASRISNVRHLQYIARRSELWWESYVNRLGLSPAQMLVSFFTRAGNVSLEKLREREPDVVARALEAYGGDRNPSDLVQWTLSRPLRYRGRDLPSRDARKAGVDLIQVECDLDDPRSPESAEFVESCIAAVSDAEAEGAELTGPSTPESVRRRLDVAEQVRFRSSALTSVRAPAEMASEVAAALIAGRTDLVSFD